jgi:hypothetical protein
MGGVDDSWRKPMILLEKADDFTGESLNEGFPMENSNLIPADPCGALIMFSMGLWRDFNCGELGIQAFNRLKHRPKSGRHRNQEITVFPFTKFSHSSI